MNILIHVGNTIKSENLSIEDIKPGVIENNMVNIFYLSDLTDVGLKKLKDIPRLSESKITWFEINDN